MYGGHIYAIGSQERAAHYAKKAIEARFAFIDEPSSVAEEDANFFAERAAFWHRDSVIARSNGDKEAAFVANPQLFHADGEPVKIGDEVISFRGESYIVNGWPKDGRNRVWVHKPDSLDEAEYYPHVFNLTWGPEKS